MSSFIQNILLLIIRIVMLPLLLLSLYPLAVSFRLVMDKMRLYEGVEDLYCGVWIIITLVFAKIFGGAALGSTKG